MTSIGFSLVPLSHPFISWSLSVWSTVSQNFSLSLIRAFIHLDPKLTTNNVSSHSLLLLSALDSNRRTIDMKIAVIGCSHGELDVIYEDIARMEAQNGYQVDLVIICGDFQAVRNENDMQCMAVPPKYRQLRTFYKYYRSESRAPKITLFIGGNHEASNYLQGLAFGGWVAPNIYYLGYASVIRFKGLRIGGISGIHNRYHANSGHFERLPFDEDTKRSIYHMRKTDVYKLLQLKTGPEESPTQPLDVMISHDWPINIHSCGDVQGLIRRKRHFLNEIQNNCLGNPLLEPLVRHLKPRHWFSAHLHVKFEALVNHTEDCKLQTRFLSLDKVLPNKQYLEIIDIEPTDTSESDNFEYDAEWLAILKATDKLLSVERKCSSPELWSRLHCVDDSDINRVKELFNNDLKIPENFQLTEPVLMDGDSDPQRTRNYVNQQTTDFCKKLGITDPMALIIESMKPVDNPDQISISDDEEDEESGEQPQKRLKENESIDGGDLFFVDKGGVETKGDTNSDVLQKEMAIEEIDLTLNSNANSMTSSNESLTKRQQKRRAEKIKRLSELRQLEKLDVRPNPEMERKRLKKLEARRATEARRKLVIDRLEWLRSNVPMLEPDTEVRVLEDNDSHHF